MTKLYGPKTGDLLDTLLQLASLILLFFAPVYFVIEFIYGIVMAIDYRSFAAFLEYTLNGIVQMLLFVALALILAAFKRLLNK